MDIFVESIVTRKKGSREKILSIGLIIISVIITFMAGIIIGPSGIIFLLIAGLIFGNWYIISSFNIEYEYSITNGEIDIDKIINKRRRKKMFTADCKYIEIMAKMTSDKYNESIAAVPKKIKAVSSMESPDVYFAMINNSGKRALIYFEPNEKFMKTLKTIIPSKISKD